MYHKLRKHLTLIYTLATGFILTCLLGICCFCLSRFVLAKNEASFSIHFLNISTKFQSESVFSDYWLSQTEADSHLIIHIEDNGIPLFFRGGWIPSTPRDTLLGLARDAASEYSVFTDHVPVSSSSVQSPIFSFDGANHDWYLGKIIVCRTSRGYKSLSLIQDITPSRKQLGVQFAFFLAIDFFGILSFALISWIFTGKCIRPLKESQQKQTAFLAAASHELRTPVAVIQTSASAIPKAPESAESLLHTIDQECRRMRRLISDLLFLASADGGRCTVNIQKQDADTLLLDIYEMFYPLYLQKRRTLQLKLPESELPPVACDHDRILQIFSILLDNALTYAPEDRPVILSAFLADGATAFSVADHGPGIPDEQKSRVFDRFYQADPSRKSSSHFGLGLSIARELTELQNGKLLLTDTPGGGCTFTLLLKAALVLPPQK